jgi:GntR family transcriptional regulator/MocR family aminotransferase
MAKTYSKGVSPSVPLDREGGRPLHAQIAAGLRAVIEDGRLAPGTRLASSRVLAADWGVSRGVVTQVFAELLDEGYLVSRVGDGSYVAERLPDAPAGDEATGANGQRYPFRHLSRRGRALMAGPRAGLPERPRPFVPNVPDLREFPMRSWLRLMNEVSGKLTGDALAGVSPAGYRPLRRAIAHHVSATRGFACTPERVIVTTGSQQALDLAVRLLTDRGDPVWMENPGYPGTRAVLEANGANVQFVPVDAEGIDVAAGAADHLSPAAICLSAARQFPTGAVLSPARRHALLAFAARCGCWIVEDDYNSEVHYDALPPPSLNAQETGGRVVTLGTFSSTMVPSLRLGYLVVPEDLASAFEAARAVSQGHASLIEQMVLAEMMNRGIYAAHLRRMRLLYRERQGALVAALHRELGHAVPEAEAASGMHLVLPLTDGAGDQDWVQRLAEGGIFAQALSPCYAGQAGRQGLLLGFAAFEPELIARAVPALAELARALRRGEAGAPLP